jgi:MoxR-like ATPase
MSTNDPAVTSPESGAADPDLPEWWVYHGAGRPRVNIRLDQLLGDPPPWRRFTVDPTLDSENDVPPQDDGEMERRLGPRDRMSDFVPDPDELNLVNAALLLRRPLLVTGPPGTGKSTLAYQIARELGLGRVLRWHITSQTTMKSALYAYDAIGRAQGVAVLQALARWASTEPQALGAAVIEALHGDESIGDFVRLGPLGTAFLPGKLPRVLLIDELDKSEMDLPNDLLGIFEDGGFEILELERARKRVPEASVFTDDPDRMATIRSGRVGCRAFPIVVITSNGERDFPPAFLRRCLQLEIAPPSPEKLAEMAFAQLGIRPEDQNPDLIQEFDQASGLNAALPADRWLEAMYLATSGKVDTTGDAWARLLDALWQRSSSLT